MKINKIFIIAGLLGSILLSSCDDWLNVIPSDQIKEEELFKTGNGFRNALNGVYRQLSMRELYGRNLSWGIIESLGQVYDLTVASDASTKDMKRLLDYKYKDNDVVSVTDAMWEKAWNSIANCNNIIQNVQTKDSTLFYGRNREKNMILGEAIALRAYIHLDLLRLYAPAPSTHPTNVYIPYVDVYPSYISNRKTVEECLSLIIRDLKEAQSIMQIVDKNSGFSTSSRFENIASGEERFLNSRGYRMNYYAITGILARAYLYAQKYDEAYTEAMKVIKKKSNFAFSDYYDIEYDGNMKLYGDVILAFYNTDLTDWDQEANHINDSKEDYEKTFIAINNVESIFGEDLEDDYRSKYQMEEVYYSYRTLKYYKQGLSSIVSRTNNNLIPALRLSEMYYIAAESIYDKNPDEAQSYLDIVKEARGLEALDYSTVNSKDDFIKLIVNDARREFIGEGQIFFMYKRLNQPIPKTSTTNVSPTNENYVMPLPDSETNLN